MISLSYSTMNAVIHEPHVWLNKQMGLKTRTTSFFEEGKAAHKVIQEHVSGGVKHPLLNNLPDFSIVEKTEQDERCRLSFPINGKYYFTGYFDGFNPETGELLEVKTGKKWSPLDFKRLVQWKLYCLANPKIKKIWLVNTPRLPNEWTPQNIRILNTEVTPQDLEDAGAFIEKAIFIIENINTVLDAETHPARSRSQYCFYEGCQWCEGNQSGV